MVSSRAADNEARPFRAKALTLLLATPLLLAGCSADVSRFDSPFLSMSDGGGSSTPPRPAAGLGRPGALADQGGTTSEGGAYIPPQTNRGTTNVRTTALPEPQPAPVAAPKAKAPAQPRQQASAAAGQSIDVQPGDTLYSISRRYQVSLTELQTLNGLQNPTIRPGQKLVLPASARAAVPRAPAVAAQPAAAPAPPVTAAPAATPAAAPAVAAAPPIADASGNYTIQKGDNLYGIARANKVKLADLMQANGITDPKHLKLGQVLKMPTPGEATTTAPAAAPAVAPVVAKAPATPNPVQAEAQAAGDGKVKIVNGGGTKFASAGGPETMTAAAGQPKFRWPVQGRVQSGFGPRTDGSNNDGIDIAVPLGTEVLAAEAGEVVYTGDGIPSFGNLVLLRHANGFVTAYAHNDQLLVKRGDKVRRGQPVAKAGKTGQVDQPMLHFEVRQGQTPVDPMPFMEKS